MSFLFGGSSSNSSSAPSYMPDKQWYQGVQGAVTGDLGYFNPTPTYTSNGQNIDSSKAEFLKKYGLGDGIQSSTTPSQYTQNKPTQDYTPGSSGYNVLGNNSAYQRQGSTNPQGQNNMWSDKAVSVPQYSAVNTNFVNQAEPYYNQIANNASNNAMLGARSAANSMASSLGQRGVAQGGMGVMGGNQLSNSLGRQLGDISTNVGFQRAQDYNQLNQAGANLQNNINQFGANLQNNMNQYNRSQDYTEQMGNRGMNLQEMLGQYGLDSGVRKEQYGYWKDPYEDMMKLYQIGMGVPATSQSSSSSSNGMFSGKDSGLPQMTGYLGGWLA